MLTSQECRQEAAECLELARETKEFYVKKRLVEMAADFAETANKLESKHKQAA
jgi:hypothetical protein